MDERFDDKIREALKRGTEGSVRMKEQVWDNIQSNIKSSVKGVPGLSDKKIARARGRLSRMVGWGAIAAVLLVTFFVGTKPGKAAIDKIRELFLPEKKIVEKIEGIPEQKEVKLKESKMGYILYFDEEMYTMVNEQNKDKIIPKKKADNLPEIYMEITQAADAIPESVAADLEKQLKTGYEIFKDYGTVDQPIKCILLYAATGQKWNDTVVKYYLVDNTKGGTFIIKQQFFVEATEGHGARFDNILKEFKIIELEQ